ncbi:hypothetical protein POSPLADRAFT_1040258, partial [Postia placenta MAD-698-R-SB12]
KQGPKQEDIACSGSRTAPFGLLDSPSEATVLASAGIFQRILTSAQEEGAYCREVSSQLRGRIVPVFQAAGSVRGTRRS